MNMQNTPRGDKSLCKAMFVSRYGEEGVLGELDYSQLEVIVQGILSKDEQLLDDIRSGVDFHCKRLAAKLHRPYDEIKRLHIEGDPSICEGRTRAKAFSFQRAYGAGANAIAMSTGMTLEEVQALIKAEEKLYPGVQKLDNEIERSISRTSVKTDKKIFIEDNIFFVRRGHWFSPTGTKYVWTEKEAPKFMQDKGTFVSFSPTERKNWPIQGTGGEIVQTMSGKIWRWFILNDRFNGDACLVNTVHDCFWLDMKKEIAPTVMGGVKKLMEAIPKYFNQQFSLDIDVPFPVEMEIGNNMLELKHYQN